MGIYVPSPQSTPYSTIQKHHSDQHKSITFLNYRGDPDSITSTSTSNSNINSKDGSTAMSHLTAEADDEAFSERSAGPSERSDLSDRSVFSDCSGLSERSHVYGEVSQQQYKQMRIS